MSLISQRLAEPVGTDVDKKWFDYRQGLAPQNTTPAVKGHGLVKLCTPMPSMIFNSPVVSCTLKLFRAIKGYP